MNTLVNLALRRSSVMRCSRLGQTTMMALVSSSSKPKMLASSSSMSASAATAMTNNAVTARHHSTKAAVNETAAKQLEVIAEDLPTLDVVRYKHKNRCWTLQHVHYYSEAMACGFSEAGLAPGSVIFSFLPEHFSETMVLQFACLKAGLVLYTLDPRDYTDNLFRMKAALTAGLKASKANVFISQDAGNDVNYIKVVEHIIPELRIHVLEKGHHFLTPRFPDLRFVLHTGFEYRGKEGWWPYSYFIVPSDSLEDFVKPEQITNDIPVLGQFEMDQDGIPIGIKAPLTQGQVLGSGLWPTVNKILKKEYHEVEGVGVVFT